MNEESRTPERDSDDVARLLRLIPPRPEVPISIAARARDAAEDEWRRLARRRRRRRSLAYAGAALAAGLALAWTNLDLIRPRILEPAVAPPAGRTAGPLAVVETVRGGAAASPSFGETAASLVVGDELTAGTVLQTAADGRTALRLAGGSSLRLDVGTRVELVSTEVLYLTHGAVYVDNEDDAGDTLEIRTPLGIARDVGTQFEVRLGGGTMRIRVRDGLVSVEHGDDHHQASAGEEIEIPPTGTPRRGQVDRHGSPWHWQLEIAPPFELEGASLADFLAWVRRETGWTVRFSDPNLAGGTDAVILRGSLAGVTPDQTPALVLPTCGLTHRLEDGVLIVDRNHA